MSQPRSAAAPESVILAEVLLALSALPDTLVWRNNVGQARDATTGQHVRFGGPPGAGDILGLVRGRFLAVEVKSARGVQSPEQKIFEAAVKARGGIYLLVRSAAEAVNALEDALRDHG